MKNLTKIVCDERVKETTRIIDRFEICDVTRLSSSSIYLTSALFDVQTQINRANTE